MLATKGLRLTHKQWRRRGFTVRSGQQAAYVTRDGRRLFTWAQTQPHHKHNKHNK